MVDDNCGWACGDITLFCQHTNLLLQILEHNVQMKKKLRRNKLNITKSILTNWCRTASLKVILTSLQTIVRNIVKQTPVLMASLTAFISSILFSASFTFAGDYWDLLFLKTFNPFERLQATLFLSFATFHRISQIDPVLQPFMIWPVRLVQLCLIMFKKRAARDSQIFIVHHNS